MTSIQKRTKPEVELGPDMELGNIIKSTPPHTEEGFPLYLNRFQKVSSADLTSITDCG